MQNHLVFLNSFLIIQLKIIKSIMDQDQKLSSACLAIDGSQHSLHVLDLALYLKNTNVLKKIVTCHLYNLKKTYLPGQYQLQSVKQQIQKRFPKQMKVIQDYKQPDVGKSINQQLLTTYHIRKCDIIFLGFCGVKGTKRKADQLSSKIRKFVFEGKTTLAIVKKKHEEKQKHVIVYCYDGSDIAYEGLLTVLDFVNALKAKLIIVHSASQDQTKFTNFIKHQIRQLKNNSKQTDIQLNIINQLGQPSSNLVRYLNNNENLLSFIVLTKNGMRGSITNKIFVGQTAYNIIVNTNTNLIVLK